MRCQAGAAPGFPENQQVLMKLQDPPEGSGKGLLFNTILTKPDHYCVGPELTQPRNLQQSQHTMLKIVGQQDLCHS